MSYENTKVYFDGSHYIGIPYKPSTAKRGVKTPEETVVITEQNEVKDGITAVNTDVADGIANIPDDTAVKPRKERRITRKELFEELYGKYRGSGKASVIGGFLRLCDRTFRASRRQSYTSIRIWNVSNAI